MHHVWAKTQIVEKTCHTLPVSRNSKVKYPNQRENFENSTAHAYKNFTDKNNKSKSKSMHEKKTILAA